MVARRAQQRRVRVKVQTKINIILTFNFKDQQNFLEKNLPVYDGWLGSPSQLTNERTGSSVKYSYQGTL